jgi:hypothetical protein
MVMKLSKLTPFQQCIVSDCYAFLVIGLFAVGLRLNWVSSVFFLIFYHELTMPFRSWGRMVEAAAKQLTLAQKRLRFAEFGILGVVGAVFLMILLPFGLDTAAFWCLHLFALLIVGTLLYSQYYYLYVTANPPSDVVG